MNENHQHVVLDENTRAWGIELTVLRTKGKGSLASKFSDGRDDRLIFATTSFSPLGGFNRTRLGKTDSTHTRPKTQNYSIQISSEPKLTQPDPTRHCQLECWSILKRIWNITNLNCTRPEQTRPESKQGNPMLTWPDPNREWMTCFPGLIIEPSSFLMVVLNLIQMLVPWVNRVFTSIVILKVFYWWLGPWLCQVNWFCAVPIFTAIKIGLDVAWEGRPTSYSGIGIWLFPGSHSKGQGGLWCFLKTIIMDCCTCMFICAVNLRHVPWEMNGCTDVLANI